ncbi:hypothetical protein OG474_22320 [Kribbella sp. NBC_01505]|uniref:hypothetical protein n=1 Tax=Kribbella sp. NBC_01505 TaxID=2903580 RepID=UPI00386C4E7D
MRFSPTYVLPSYVLPSYVPPWLRASGHAMRGQLRGCGARAGTMQPAANSRFLARGRVAQV